MPWCPKCKSEYRVGFTVCADCGSTLMDDDEFAAFAAECKKEYPATEAERSAGRDSAPGSVIKDSEESLEHIRVEEKGAESGEEMRVRRDETADFGSPQGDMHSSASDRSGFRTSVYQDSSERAGENRSAAWVLMAVGGVGIVCLGLSIADIIPLHFGNSYLFSGVMAAVFILFLVAGIVSMKNALIFEKKAESENSVRDTMLKWCRENLDAAELDRQIGADGGEAEEALYFRRFAYIRDRLNYQFVNLDQDFLDRFIDDCVYDEIFGEKAESA